MNGVVRASATFPPDLLEEFDQTTKVMGYKSRSKAIQDVMKALVVQHKWMSDEKGTRVGVLVVVYNHHMRNLQEMLTEIQHEYRDIICSSMHLHLDEQMCLEAIAVRGKVNQIRQLSNKLGSKRGVQYVRPTILSV
jgi:CopG family nickel-responsive transcriptional regulator